MEHAGAAFDGEVEPAVGLAGSIVHRVRPQDCLMRADLLRELEGGVGAEEAAEADVIVGALEEDKAGLLAFFPGTESE